jgi:hypothetical protein
MWLIMDQIKSKQSHFDVPSFSASLMYSKMLVAVVDLVFLQTTWRWRRWRWLLQANHLQWIWPLLQLKLFPNIYLIIMYAIGMIVALKLSQKIWSVHILARFSSVKQECLYAPTMVPTNVENGTASLFLMSPCALVHKSLMWVTLYSLICY